MNLANWSSLWSAYSMTSHGRNVIPFYPGRLDGVYDYDMHSPLYLSGCHSPKDSAKTGLLLGNPNILEQTAKPS